MFGMGLWEILLVVLLILVVMGPEKIPEAAKLLGKGVREVRKMSNLLRDAVDLDLDEPPRNRSAKASSSSNYASNEIDGGDRHEFEPEPTTRPPEIFAVPMSARAAIDADELTLAPPKDPEVHREVYLHVPFEETI